jgi:hypothetical protein
MTMETKDSMMPVLRRVFCTLLLALLSACGGGAGGSSSLDSGANAAPSPLVLASGDLRMESGVLRTSLGALVRLDGTASSDADADPLTYVWTLLASPPGSNAPRQGAAADLSWQPDTLGTYTYSLKVTDPKGAFGTQQVSVTVDNRGPESVLVVTARFEPTPVDAPAQSVAAGATVVVDASGSNDPDGDPVSVSFEWAARPAGSLATLVSGPGSVRFSPDAIGRYVVRVQGSDPGGARFISVHTFDADNHAPNPVVVARSAAAAGASSFVQASLGYDVLLDGAVSSDPAGSPLTTAWVLASRPAGSSATLSAATGARSSLSPDVFGDYVVTMTATDAQGASNSHTTTIRVANRRPLALIAMQTAPDAQPSAPTALLPPGTQVTLRGDGSTDADGDRLVYAWSIDARPDGSKAMLSSATSATPTFVPDGDGHYVFRLRVTDPAGAFSERTVSLQSGTHAPVALVNQRDANTFLGVTLRPSALASFDEDGDALSYAWSVSSRPAASSASVNDAGSATASFAPDYPGTYVLTVRVSDGRASSVAAVNVNVSGGRAVPLPFAIDLNPSYSRSLDLLVTRSSGEPAVRVISPFSGAIATVALPAQALFLKLSPDGKFLLAVSAASFSLVDLRTGTVLRTTPTAGDYREAVVTDAGLVYLLTREGGDLTNPDDKLAVFDGRTGARVVLSGVPGSADFAAVASAVLAGSTNKVFFARTGANQISWLQFDPATAQVVASGRSPQLAKPIKRLAIADDGSLLFDGSGSALQPDDFAVVANLDTTNLRSFSYSAARQEALVVNDALSNIDGISDLLATYYTRLTGPLLAERTTVRMPVINGQQTYATGVFQSSNGTPVVLAQSANGSLWTTFGQTLISLPDSVVP